MARPRIGVDFHTWDGIHQGSRSYLLGLFSEAVRLAPDLDFCFLASDIESLQAKSGLARYPNAFFLRMPSRPGPYRLLFQLPWLMLRHRLTLLHLTFRIPPIHLGRCVVTIHDLLFESHPQFFKPLFRLQMGPHTRFSARHARKVFTISAFTRQELVDRYGLSRDQIAITYCGADLEKFSPLPGPSDAAILSRFQLPAKGFVLTVGRLEPRKNHRTLIRAFVEAGLRELPLVIVGQRDFGSDQILSEIAEAQAQGYDIRLLESVDDGVLPILLRQCMLFAYLSFAEGFGIPPLEALASGSPVLASNTSAIPEVVGEAGVLVDPTDIPATAAALQRLLRDPELRRGLADQAAAQAHKFQWSASAQVLVDEYRKLLGRLSPTIGP